MKILPITNLNQSGDFEKVGERFLEVYQNFMGETWSETSKNMRVHSPSGFVDSQGCHDVACFICPMNIDHDGKPYMQKGKDKRVVEHVDRVIKSALTSLKTSKREPTPIRVTFVLCGDLLRFNATFAALGFNSNAISKCIDHSDDTYKNLVSKAMEKNKLDPKTLQIRTLTGAFKNLCMDQATDHWQQKLSQGNMVYQACDTLLNKRVDDYYTRESLQHLNALYPKDSPEDQHSRLQHYKSLSKAMYMTEFCVLATIFVHFKGALLTDFHSFGSFEHSKGIKQFFRGIGTPFYDTAGSAPKPLAASSLDKLFKMLENGLLTSGLNEKTPDERTPAVKSNRLLPKPIKIPPSGRRTRTLARSAILAMSPPDLPNIN